MACCLFLLPAHLRHTLAGLETRALLPCSQLSSPINSVELTHACALCSSSHEMCISWGPPVHVMYWREAAFPCFPSRLEWTPALGSGTSMPQAVLGYLGTECGRAKPLCFSSFSSLLGKSLSHSTSVFSSVKSAWIIIPTLQENFISKWTCMRYPPQHGELSFLQKIINGDTRLWYLLLVLYQTHIIILYYSFLKHFYVLKQLYTEVEHLVYYSCFECCVYNQIHFEFVCFPVEGLFFL